MLGVVCTAGENGNRILGKPDVPATLEDIQALKDGAK